ncbi:DUF6113 family protein [Streptomyces natalensis]|uniref:DUF6113 family protein n=1 Tax=Streptomyces natalensis TaxID=68242 RepID=UPI000AE11C9A|nr:DUF6113 family protein [Streptomyces natalensis]
MSTGNGPGKGSGKGPGKADGKGVGKAAGKGGAAGGKGNGSGAPQRSRAGGGASAARPVPPAPPRPAAGPSAPVTPGRIGLYVLLLVTGVLVAVAGTLVQAAWFPGGLLLALAAAAGLFHGGATATGTLAGALIPGAGWLVAVFILLSQVRPEGDFLFGAGTSSYLFLAGGLAVAVICATVAQRRAVGVPHGRVGG